MSYQRDRYSHWEPAGVSQTPGCVPDQPPNSKKEAMKSLKYVIGQWVMSEHELKQIKEMEGTRITSVSDGMFSTGGSDLGYCTVPLTMQTKCLSDTYSYYYKQIRDAAGTMNINFPDISRAITSNWHDACMAALIASEESEESIKQAIRIRDKFEKEFVRPTLNELQAAKDIVVAGVNVLRRR